MMECPVKTGVGQEQSNATFAKLRFEGLPHSETCRTVNARFSAEAAFQADRFK